MAFDLRILRSALVPLALMVCVTVALWNLRAGHVAPAHPSHVSHLQQFPHGSEPTVRSSTHAG